MAWTRLRQVALVAEQLAPVVEHLHEVFGLEVAFRDPGVASFGLENAVIPVGSQLLEVVAPIREGTAGGRQLARRGEGGYMAIFHTDDHAGVRSRVEQLGVRSVVDLELRGGYACYQLHPSDTGGTFLEVDFQPGGEDPDGPWHPAGADWQRAKRTDVVDGILGVELECADPQAVAGRWAAILDVPMSDADGLVVHADHGEVRFVAAPAGLPDGFSSVTLSAVDAERARSAASAQGLLQDDGTVRICGTRFTLR